MTEQYGFRFVVDASDAAKGWKQFEAAVVGVFSALDKMEAHVDKTMSAVNKGSRSAASGIRQITAAGKALNSVRFDGRATKNIHALNAAMKSFKSPSSSQVRNTRAFFKALEGLGRGGGPAAARNITALKSAMAGFKAPTTTNVKNIRGFMNALSSFRPSNLTNAAGFFASLRQISGFKAPSATQVKNLQMFLTTVANLRIPRNGSQIARVLEQISRASISANKNLRGLRGNIGGFNWGRFNSGARTASINMMGVQNAFSATYQMGSLLRSLFGALTIAELGRGFLDATNRIVTFNASMSVISREAGFANEQLGFVTDTVRRLGLDYGATTEAFAKFAISADKAGASAAQSRDIFEGFATSMSVMGLAADKQNDVMLALQQIMNKGYFAAEELNQQLNEHLPGALGFLRTELAKTGTKLEDALKNKAIDATQGLLFLAKMYRDEFGPALSQALNRPAAQMNILRTNVNKFFEVIAQNGGNDAFTGFLKRINAYMRPEDVERYGKAVGALVQKYMNKLADAVDWLAQNWDKLKGPLSTTLSLLGKWLIISGSFQIGKWLVTPIFGAVTAFKNLIPVMGQALILMRALNAQSLAGLLTSVRGMNPATLTMLGNMNNLKKTLTTIPKAPFKGISTGLTSLSSTTSSVTSGISGKFIKMGGAIAAGLGVAFAAARDETKTYEHDAYSTTEIVAGAFLLLGDQIKNMWNGVTDFMAEKFGWVGTAIQSVLSGLWDAVKWTLHAVGFGFNKMLSGLWKTAKSVFEGLANQVKLIASAFTNLTSGNFGAALGDVGDFFSGKGFGAAFTDNFSGFLDDMPGQFNRARQSASNFYGVVSQGMTAAGARGRGIGSRARAANITPEEYLDSLYQGPESLLRTGEDDGKGAKGSKGRKGRKIDPAKELDRLQRKVDRMMRTLAEDNPLIKLNQDYVNDLTEQAQALLTDGGYDKWMKAISDSGGDASIAMFELQDALTGAGADQLVLADLSRRYGVTVDDLNSSIERSLRAYQFKQIQAKEEMTFGATLLRQKNEEIHLTRFSATENKVLSEVMDTVKDSREKGLKVSQEQIDHLAEELRLRERYMAMLEAEREFYENNGVQTYVNDLKTAGEAIHELDKNFLQSFEDTLFRIGKEGKLSIKSLIDTVQDGFLRLASQNITGAFANLFSGEGQNSSIFSGLFGAMGFKTGFDKQKALQRIDARNVQLYGGTVNINGRPLSGGLGANLLNGGGQGGDILVEGFKDSISTEMREAMMPPVDAIGQQMQKQWGSSVNNVGGILQSVLQQATFGAFGGGGGGGFLGGIVGIAGGLLGGGNLSRLTPGVDSMIAANPGIFKEGGLSGNPVARAIMPTSSFTNAPHFAEGTANSSGGGHPAILHDNEAVIPLSRGRKVPVELTNEEGRDRRTVVNNTWHVETPDADSFKRSKTQIAGQMHRAAVRAVSRDN